MRVLQGQNFRLLLVDNTESTPVAVPIAMATTCTVTLTGNTDDASHKDLTGMASLPTVTSLGWGMTVSSFDVTNLTLFLNAVKNSTQMLVMYDETDTVYNRVPQHNLVSRKGYAYINDFTLTFNDRENSVQNVQFAGTGLLDVAGSVRGSMDLSQNEFTKGQSVRLFLSDNNMDVPAKPIAAAKQLSVHFSVAMESNTTKDTDTDWIEQEPTGLSYEITTNALIKSNQTITSGVAAHKVSDIQNLYENANPVRWQIANVSGANNRTKGSVIVSGSAVITSLAMNGPNRASADYSATLTGYGGFAVGQ